MSFCCKFLKAYPKLGWLDGHCGRLDNRSLRLAHEY